MAKTKANIRSLCRSYTTEVVRILASIAREEKHPPAARIAACALLLDRGWGKAPQPHTGEDGEGDIQITIRHILDGSEESEPLLIEHETQTPD